MSPMYLLRVQKACYDIGQANQNEAMIPELWAQEGLAILEENMVAANLVHRDFENEIKQFGDVVNTRKPGEFKVSRKADGVTLTHSPVVTTNVQVPLDQWFQKSFVIKDGEGSLSFQDLVTMYLRPAMQSIARGIDRAVLGRVHAYLNAPGRRVGRLANLNASNAKDYVLDAREILNINKAPVDGRNLVLAPAAETALLKTELFIKANERGDSGTALENATLGRILGFQTFLDQNVNSVLANCDMTAATVSAAYAAEYAGAQASAGIDAVAVVGEYCVVDGNDQPTWIAALAADAFTLNEANKYATLADADVTRYNKCLAAADYPAKWSVNIRVDGHAANKGPQTGQLLAFGTGAGRKVYTIIENWVVSATETDVLLDRPLEIAVANNEPAFPGPMGSMNLAFHRDAIALVTRPLAIPTAGVNAGHAAYNNLTMRVAMQYDLDEGGTKVNCDMLAGVAVLDSGLCVVLQG